MNDPNDDKNDKLAELHRKIAEQDEKHEKAIGSTRRNDRGISAHRGRDDYRRGRPRSS